MAGKPQAEKAVERFPELGCFAVAVRRIVYEKGMTLDNDGLGITPEELIAAMRKEAEVREKSNGERAENDE